MALPDLMRKYLQLEEVGDGIGRIHMLKKIVKEADNIVTDLHNIDASWVVSGILALARIPNIDWVRISANFPRTIAELLSDHNLANHPLGIIPVMDWTHISGLFPRTIAQLLSDHNLANHPLAIIPVMDDGHIPDLETLSYGAAFAVAQIPGLPASQITSGQFPLARMPRAASGLFLEGNGAADPIFNALIAGDIPNLDAAKITTGVFPVARGGTGLSSIALGGILYASALDVLSRLAPTAANQVLRSTAANALQFAALLAADIPNLDAAKITSGAFILARIPNMDWAHISGLFPRTIAALLSDHDLARHVLGTIVPHDALASLTEKSHGSLTGVTADQHHARYTNAEAQTTVKANVEVGDLKAPTKALAMNSQNITGVASLTATELHGTTYWGDVYFEDVECPLCHRRFEKGDKIILMVNVVEEKYISAFPIHQKCGGG